MRLQNIPELVQFQPTINTNIDIVCLETFLFQTTHRFEDALVLGFGGNNVWFLVPIVVRYTLDGDIIRLGSSRCEYYLFLVGINELGYVFAGLLHRLGDNAAGFVLGMAVTKLCS